MRHKSKGGNVKIRSAIVLPDMQVPFHDEKTLRAVEKFMRSRRWDYYINLGDFMDLPMLSKFSKGLAGEIENMDVHRDFSEGHKILKRHEAIIRGKNKNAEMVLLQGNHENRTTRYCQEFPYLREILDVERNLKLRELGIKWVTCYDTGALYRIGHAYFHHGRFTSKYHAAKHVDYFGKNIFYGHLHDVQVHTRVNHGDGSSLVGASLGCLCRYDQTYIKGSPTNWQQAFAVFYFFPDGTFTYNVVRIFGHRFIVDGKVYQP